MGVEGILRLGNLNSKRDWGYAKEYVESMWLMLQQDQADDYVIATGKTYSVRDFVYLAFMAIGIKLKWIGSGLNEKGINMETGQVLVAVDEAYFRPAEVDLLIGDYSKAKKVLGWEPKTSLEELVMTMVEEDIKQLRQGHSEFQSPEVSFDKTEQPQDNIKTIK